MVCLLLKERLFLWNAKRKNKSGQKTLFKHGREGEREESTMEVVFRYKHVHYFVLFMKGERPWLPIGCVAFRNHTAIVRSCSIIRTTPDHLQPFSPEQRMSLQKGATNVPKLSLTTARCLRLGL